MRHSPTLGSSAACSRSQNYGNARRTSTATYFPLWEQRADGARRDIAALAAVGLGVSELHAAAIRVIGGVVSVELTCWAAIDPETLVISTMASGETQIPPEYEPRLAEAEYSHDEPHTFASLAARNQLVAKLTDLPAHERHRSARLHTVWRPLGLENELRLMFLADGACWGAASRHPVIS